MDFAPALIHRDPAAIAAAEAAKARIQAAYIMALQKPRNEDDSRVRILDACRRPAFAERVEYSKPVGTRRIKGPSARFAELAIRAWGNCHSETQTLYEDDEIRRIRVSVLDLETNACFSKEIQIRKTVERRNKSDREVVGERVNTNGEKVYIVKATDEELQNKENALISKAVRNEGLRLIPTDIVDEAIDIARQTIADKIKEDPKAYKKRIIDGFAALGIMPSALSKYLKHSIDSVSPAELDDLKGVWRAIRDGEATWADYIEEEGDNKPQARTLDVDPATGEVTGDPYAVQNGGKPQGKEDAPGPGDPVEVPSGPPEGKRRGRQPKGKAPEPPSEPQNKAVEQPEAPADGQGQGEEEPPPFDPPETPNTQGTATPREFFHELVQEIGLPTTIRILRNGFDIKRVEDVTDKQLSMVIDRLLVEKERQAQ